MDAKTSAGRGKSSPFAKTLKEARQMTGPSGWKKTVMVWAVNDPIEWHLESSLKDPKTGYLVFNKHDDQMRKRDYYLIEFKLQDHSGLNLKFKPNPMDAFAVAIGTASPPLPACPRQGSYSNSIYAVSSDPDGTTLTIRNDDMNVEYFAFALYFDSDTGDQCYDPGGSNQDSSFNYRY